MNKKTIKYNEVEEANLKLVIGICRSYTYLNRRTQKVLAEYKLTVAQFGVLEALYHLGDLKINDIIEKTLSTSGNMTVVIKNLEKEHLIERYRDSSDSRICMIRIANTGKDLIRKVFPEHLLELDKVFMNLDFEERQELIHLLKKLNNIE